FARLRRAKESKGERPRVSPHPNPLPGGEGIRQDEPLRQRLLDRLRKQRQYRGGYQVAGLLTLARELRQKQTNAEGLLWELLRDRRFLGFKFRRQHQFGEYLADFFCREA